MANFSFSQDEYKFCSLLKKLSEGNEISAKEFDIKFSAEELRILKNVIFARHGRTFSSTELQYYFYQSGSRPCGLYFKINPAYSDDLLTDIDKININIIKTLNIPKRFSGTYFDTDSDETILGIPLPSYVYILEKSYGEPTKLSLPDPDDPSPMGQWFFWQEDDKPYILSVLGDDYSQTPNFEAKVRFIELNAHTKTVAVKTIFGFELNKTRLKYVKEKFGDSLINSDRFDYKIYTNSLWYYFNFDNDEILVKVAQSIFDVDLAD